MVVALLAILAAIGLAGFAAGGQSDLPPLTIPDDSDSGNPDESVPLPELPAPPPDQPSAEPPPAAPSNADPVFTPLFEDISGRAESGGAGADQPSGFWRGPTGESATGGSRLGNPDSLQATSAEVSPDGVVHASGGTLHVTSLVEGTELLLTADEIEYDTHTGVAELWGNVDITVSTAALRLQCTHIYYDPLMQHMEAEGIRLQLPITDVLGTAPEAAEPVAQLTDHFYFPRPEAVFIDAARARLDFDPYKQQFVLSEVKLCHNPDPDPDLYITAREARYGTDNILSLSGLSLYISGRRIAGWPSYTRHIPPQPGIGGLQLPHITINRDVGFAIKQGYNAELGALKAHGLIDYSTRFGGRAFGYLYTEPAAGAQLGISAGGRSETNPDRINIDRRDDYDLQYRQDFHLDNNWIDQLRLTAEYGRSVVHNEAAPELGIEEQIVRDTRFKATGAMKFPLARLSDNLYLTSAALGFLTDYTDASERYEGLGGEAGVIWRHQGYDNFVLYRSYQVLGNPVFLFDKVREQEINFGGRVKLQPGWRHVVQGIYDLDRDRFDTLQVGALKEFKTYELGMYWDFARDNAGLEFGLLVN